MEAKMAINVIKHGETTFRVTCPTCGCEFTYAASDLETDMFGNHFVHCPDCKREVPHAHEPKRRGDVTWIDHLLHKDQKTPWTLWTISEPDSCEDCSWYKSIKDRPFEYVGDTPCDWCRKRTPYCTFSVSTAKDANYDGTVTATNSEFANYSGVIKE